MYIMPFTSDHILPTEALLASIPIPIVWKRIDSSYICCSLIGAKMIGAKDLDEISGMSDYTLPNGPTQLADTFVNQDKEIIATQQCTHYLDIHSSYDNEIPVYLSTKNPVFDESGKCIATCTTLEKLNSSPLPILANELLNRSNKSQDSLKVYNSITQSIFTTRELDCIFFLIRGYSSKETAERLNLSYRTVEFYTQNIKNKLALNTKKQLIEYAIANGYMAYIPQWLLTKSCSRPYKS
ncbi:MAG: LuxR C-terminal-related transcriptional regulator [Coxiellaceae bacterium]|nr:LuxR C-terminal-related transcriptional regulator [Coxiellaceae bacterium]